MFRDEILCSLQTIAGERLAVYFLRNVTEIVMFPMTRQTQNGCDNQLRWAAGAGTFYRRADNVEALCQISAVHFVTFEAVTAGAIDQLVTREFALVRGGIRVMIVGGDDHQRHMLDRRNIQSFMAGA